MHFSYCSWGSQGKNTEVVCHSLLQGTTFCQTSPPWPSSLGWPHTAWLSFIELDKAVVHVITLASFMWFALSQHLPSYLGFSYLGRGVSLHGCSSKVQPLLLTLDKGHGSSSKAQPLLLTLDEGYRLMATPPDLGRGVAPLSPPAQPPLLGRRVAPLRHCPDLRLVVAPLGRCPWPWTEDRNGMDLREAEDIKRRWQEYTEELYWSFSFSISPSNEHPGLISLGWAGWISLQSKGLSRVFSNTTVQKQLNWTELNALHILKLHRNRF